MAWLTRLDVEDAGDGVHWIVIAPLQWRCDVPGKFWGCYWTVPSGFVTDLASIPWGVRAIFPRDGLYREAAVLHDWLCAQIATSHFTLVGWNEAADLFDFAMQDSGVNPITRALFKFGVRLYGESRIVVWRELLNPVK